MDKYGQGYKNNVKKVYYILGLIGAIIWVATVFLRGTTLMNNDVIRQILWVAPNFGVVWVGVEISIMAYEHCFKKEFSAKYFCPLVGIIIVILLLSEIIYAIFLNSPFDIRDMYASLIAAFVLILIHIVGKRKAKGEKRHERDLHMH